MQVVLRSDVDSLGLRGEVVNVARGYARNYLLPRGLAEVATPGLVAEVARREARHARQEARNHEEAEELVARLEALELRFEVKAGPTGSLFGSVTATNVAEMLWQTEKIRIDRRKLGLSPIKRIGHYTAPLEIFAGVSTELRLVVVPEGGELPSEEELAALGEVEEGSAARESSTPSEVESLDDADPAATAAGFDAEDPEEQDLESPAAGE